MVISFETWMPFLTSCVRILISHFQLYILHLGGTTSINPALKLTHGDGIMASELKFSGIRTIPVSSDVVETIIELKDKLYDINVSLHFKAYQKRIL